MNTYTLAKQHQCDFEPPHSGLINHNLTPDLVNNADLFSDDFFQRFTLHHDAQALTLDDDTSKNYFFPTFYRNALCAQAMFTCDFKAAQHLISTPDLQPVKAPKGRAMIFFSTYRYNQVMNIAPYNEIAMMIPVQFKPLWNPPLLPLFLPTFKHFGYFVFNMPVTSLENQIRGNKIWGLPKVLHAIRISQSIKQCQTEAWDHDGNLYCKLSVPMSGQSKQFDSSAYLYTVLENHYLKSKTCFKGDFVVNKNTKQLWNIHVPTDQVSLTLGSGPVALQLNNLDIDPVPFQTRYCDSLNACFDLPDSRAPIAK